jgi:adenylate cyclase
MMRCWLPIAARPGRQRRASLALAREAAPDTLAKFYDMYEARIAEYMAAPPPEDWDGVYVATTKGG